MEHPAIVNVLPHPHVGSATYIVVPHAQPLRDGRWIADGVIQWPDGSYDVGAAGSIAGNKKGAEAKACERWGAIENGQMKKLNPKP